ncbi:HTH_Tnp_Tc3_2 domain-containing protein [Trichonephila clavipes]|nr:HTH_Tnp_Tc3_2 domain-containing protein [Trichonephila clavipes]
MHHVRSRNAYQHVSDFDTGRIVEHWDCGLSYRSIAARINRYPINDSRIWHGWAQDGKTECRTESQQPPITSSREERHTTRMILMDRTVTIRGQDKELVSFERQQVSARTVRRRLQQHGLSARRPWLRLPFRLSIFNGVINDEPEGTNCEMSFFQMNPGSVYSIKMVSSLTGSIVVNAH